MLNRTTPRRLTFIVIALILGILLGLALFPSGDVAGAEDAGICDSVSEISLAECQALVLLYESTNGGSWSNSSGWLESTTPCSWYGVTCRDSSVWALDLSDNQLTGPLPPAIADLSQLHVLLLNKNEINGSIPPQLGQLASLTRLNLSYNQLSGTIPLEITDLDNLQNLSVAYNGLSGEIPGNIGDMLNLESLEFLSNTLEGPIPADLGNAPNLGWVDLTDNMITGTIPSELATATALKTLFVKGNRLEGEVPAVLCETIINAKFSYNKLDPMLSDPCIQEAVIDHWENTQTVPPVDLVADLSVPGEVNLTWTPVSELPDIGYYEVLYSQNSDGPYTVHGETADKQTTNYTISDLDTDQELFFVVRTITPAHDQNQNDLVSAKSAVAPTSPNAIGLTEFQASQPLLPLVTLLIIPLILLTLGLVYLPLLVPYHLRRE